MAFNLTNWLEEKTADIIPGGKTGQTVRAQRSKPAPAQTVSRAPLQVGPAQTRKVTVQQAPQRNISVQPTRHIQPQGFYSSQARIDPVRLGKLNSQLNKGASFEDASDQTGLGVEEIREYTTATRPQYGVNKFNLVNDAKKFVGGMADAVADIAQKPATTLAPRKDAENAYQALRGAYKRGDITQSKFNQETSSLSKDVIGKKTTINDKGFAENKNQNALEFGQSFTDAGYNAASVIPVARGAQIAAKSTGNALRPLLKEAVAWGTTDTVNDAVQGRLSPEQTLVNYGLNAALPAAGYGVTKAVQNAAPVAKQGLLETAKAAKEVNKKIEQVNPQVAELDNHVGLLRQQEQSLLSRGLAENNAALINNRKAQTDALNTRQSLTQGGYIAGPGAKGFKAAQARGEVFDGVDGKPRFEVDDSKSKIDKSKIGYQTPLNEILDHPQLFNDYPKLKDIKVTQDASNTGSFDLDTNEMRIGAYAKSPKKQVLHEVQHAIQKEEGFARGGDLENGWDNYQRLAGEAESRAVESRINMKPGERTIKPFYDSLDVPKEDLIIKNGDGPAMSIDPKTADNFKYQPIDGVFYKKQAAKQPSGAQLGEIYRLGGRVRPQNMEEASQYIDHLKKENGRYIQSDANLPGNASGSLKRKVQIANKQADREITQSVNSMTSDLSEAANVPANRVRNEAVSSLDGSEAVQQIEAQRIDLINQAIVADKTHKINVKQIKGKAQEYIAIEGDDTGSIQLKPMDDNHFMRSDGVVVDKKGKSVGSYVRVEGQDIIAYVGGKPLNITNITGDPNSWGRMNKVTHTMTRLIETNAPNKATADKVHNFLIAKKMENEAVMKTELKTIRTELRTRESDLKRNLPHGRSKKELTEDIMKYGERKIDIDEVKAKYGPEYTQQIVEFDKWARESVYDQLLYRANKELIKFGKDPIPRRNNYYTHFLDPSFWEKVGLGIQDLGVFGKGISSDINPQGVRNGLPTAIDGQTDQFKPITKWNPFAQTRRGSYTKQDAFGAIDAYLEPIMFNIHMTEPAARARVIEKTFRAADQLKSDTLDQLTKELDEAKKVGAESIVQDKIDAANAVKPKEVGDTGASSFVLAVQEYANSLAGKTNRIDRQINSFGKAGQAVIKAGGTMQRIAGGNSIPGNLSSAVAQVLSLPQTIALNKQNVFAGIGKTVRYMGHKAANDPIRKSAFMRARYTDAESVRRGAVRKYTDAASVPLTMIERAMGELNWYSNYTTLSKKGLQGDTLIRETDKITEKTLAGRGIGDKPEAFRSTAANTILQFGLEVNNSRVQFWKEFTMEQKAYFAVSAYAMNFAIMELYGQSYLPDYIDASIDEYNKWTADESDKAPEEKRSTVDKVMGTSQRFLGETAKFVPGAGPALRFGLGEKGSEAVFGKDSDMVRFNETPITKVGTAIANVGGGIAKQLDNDKENNTQGLKDMRKGVLGVVPTGTGINKFVEGAETLVAGQYTDKNGKAIVKVDNRQPANWAKGLAFGKYAIDEVKDKFQDIGDGKKEDKKASSTASIKNTGTSDTAAGDLLTANKERTKKLRESISEADYDIVQLSKKDREKLVASGQLSQKKVDGLMGYYNNKRKELGYDSSAGKAEKDKADTGWTDEYNAAKKDHDENSKNWSAVERANKDKELKRLDTKRHFSKDTTTLYAMSKADVYDYVSQAKDGKKAVDEIVRYGDKMVEAGLYMYNKFRDKNGNVLLNAPGTTTAKGGKKTSGRTSSGKKTASKGTKAKKGKFEYKLDGFSKISSSNSKDLYDLMKMAKLKNGIS